MCKLKYNCNYNINRHFEKKRFNTEVSCISVEYAVYCSIHDLVYIYTINFIFHIFTHLLIQQSFSIVKIYNLHCYLLSLNKINLSIKTLL